jgi:hypothetical protein
MRSACSATAQETKTPTPGNDGVPPKTTRSPAQPSATVSPPETASMTSTPAWETILSKAAGSGTTSRVESAQTSCLAAGAPTSSTVARVRPTAVSHPTVSPAYSVKLAPQEISSCSARVATTFSPAAETTTRWMVGWAGTTCPAKKATIASSLATSRTGERRRRRRYHLRDRRQWRRHLLRGGRRRSPGRRGGPGGSQLRERARAFLLPAGGWRHARTGGDNQRGTRGVW